MNLKRYCYDCGRRKFHDPIWMFSRGQNMWECAHCGELVYEDERVGPIKALIRFFLFPVHSNTDDPEARGWRYGILGNRD